jgi:uncharacterized membrane-anchored protein
MKKILACLIIALSALLAGPQFLGVAAQKTEPKADPKPSPDLSQPTKEQIESMLNAMKQREELASKLKFQQGVVPLKDGLATLKVPGNFRYLDPDQADTVLVKIWGNPPREEKTLGMLFPAEDSVVGEGAWGVVITYAEDGYVKDDEATSINYSELLKQMQ